MAYYDGVANAVIFQMAVAGTHFSGKSTTVESFRDPDLEAELGFGEAIPEYNFGQPYGLGLVELTLEGYGHKERETTRLIPVVTIAEAATEYARQQQDPAVVTTNYTFEHQRQIDLHASAALLFAKVAIGVAFKKLRQHQKVASGLANIGVILSDREALEGKAYSALRTPEQDDDSHKGLPFRSWLAEQQYVSMDRIFMSDYRDVPFEPNEMRLPDTEFREQIDMFIRKICQATCAEALRDLSGTPEQRHGQIIGEISLLNWSFVAQSPLTGYLEMRSAQEIPALFND